MSVRRATRASSCQVEQGDLRGRVQPDRRECGADPPTDVHAGGPDSEQPLDIRGAEVGQADPRPRHAKFDLPPMIVTRQGQRNAERGGTGEDLRAVRQQKPGDGRIG